MHADNTLLYILFSLIIVKSKTHPESLFRTLYYKTCKFALTKQWTAGVNPSIDPLESTANVTDGGNILTPRPEHK